MACVNNYPPVLEYRLITFTLNPSSLPPPVRSPLLSFALRDVAPQVDGASLMCRVSVPVPPRVTTAGLEWEPMWFSSSPPEAWAGSSQELRCLPAAACVECLILGSGKEEGVINIHLLFCHLLHLDQDQEEKRTSTKEQQQKEQIHGPGRDINIKH